MKRSGLSGWVVLFAASLVVVCAAWAARPAVVRGPERAFMRRGPGTEFQAFATVEDGERVQVDEVTGTWALVKSASGQTGYVHAAFLFYPDGGAVLAATPTVGVAATAPAATPAEAAAATPSAATPAVVAGGDLEQRNAALAAEIEALRAEVETLRRAGPPPSPGEDLVSLRAEVRRLADITDALRSRLDSPGVAVPLGPDGQWATATVGVLAGCALILGWVLGGALARREERSRRNRIRF